MEIDIIINYSENDNQKEEKKNGWVDDFSRFLNAMLFQVLGHEPVIQKKSESSSLSTADLKNTGVMISILSPAFVESGQCIDALEEFDKISSKSEQSDRIFKVLKEAVPIDQQPSVLNDCIPYELYDLDVESGEAVVFSDYFGPAAENIYWMKMVDLAYDVHEKLLEVRSSQAADGVKSLFDREVIYLAETAPDLSIQRNVIRRELQRHGYKVLPDHTLPKQATTLEKTIMNELSQSKVSVHLVGNTYGDVPEGGDRSVIDLQNKLAADKIKSEARIEGLQRLIWISPDQEDSSDQQKNFIENIQRDLTSLEGAEVLQTPLEDFKNTLREELFDVSYTKTGKAKEFHVDDKKINAYVISDQVDESGVAAVTRDLIKAGLNVINTDFDGDVLDLRKSHIEKLRQLDIGIIYKGEVNDNWIRMKLLDLLKAPGLGRTKPILGRAIITGDGAKINEELFADFDVTLMSTDRKKPLSEQIDEFISGLNKPL